MKLSFVQQHCVNVILTAKAEYESDEYDAELDDNIRSIGSNRCATQISMGVWFHIFHETCYVYFMKSMLLVMLVAFSQK